MSVIRCTKKWQMPTKTISNGLYYTDTLEGKLFPYNQLTESFWLEYYKQRTSVEKVKGFDQTNYIYSKQGT